MSIADLMLACTFGNRTAPTVVELALFSGDRELVDGGYQRVRVRKGAWTIRDGEMTTTARFGRFQGRVSFDRVVYLVENNPVDEDRFATEAVNPGGAWEYEPVNRIRQR